MQEEVAVAGTGLSQGERLIDTLVAPSKTFTDILRSTSWWLPFVFMVLVGFIFSAAIDKKVGFDQIAQQQIEKNHFAADRINALPPDQRAAQYHAAAGRTRVTTYAYSIIILIFAAIVSLLWWATLNFGFVATTKYSQVFAVWMYAALPKSIMALLAAVLLFAGVGIDNFDIQNPLGTNPGYYIADSSAGLKAAMGFIDVFALWSLALAVIGTAIIARKKPSQTAIVVVGWWLFALLLSAGAAAAFS